MTRDVECQGGRRRELPQTIPLLEGLPAVETILLDPALYLDLVHGQKLAGPGPISDDSIPGVCLTQLRTPGDPPSRWLHRKGGGAMVLVPTPRRYSRCRSFPGTASRQGLLSDRAQVRPEECRWIRSAEFSRGRPQPGPWGGSGVDSPGGWIRFARGSRRLTVRGLTRISRLEKEGRHGDDPSAGLA
jgi:hypothetical protein